MATRTPDFPYTFGGAATRSVDTKGRFHLPFRFRNKTGGGAVDNEEREKYMFSPGLGNSVSLMPHSVWEDNFNRMRSEKPTAEDFKNRRLMSLRSIMVQPDSQGRVTIPPKFLKMLGLGKKVTVVGMGTYMELWEPKVAEEMGLGEDSEGLDEDFMHDFYR
jgi:MraZ protein